MTTKTQTKPKTKSKKSAPSAKPKNTAARPKTKQAVIRGLVERPNGASIAELTKVTKWQAHSVRAALTGLRKAGTNVIRTTDDSGITRYCTGGEQ